jgi:hypothetical protein
MRHIYRHKIEEIEWISEEKIECRRAFGIQGAGDEVAVRAFSGIQMLSKKKKGRIAREYGWVYGELI